MSGMLKRLGRNVKHLLRAEASLLRAPTAKVSFASQGEDLVLDRLLRKRLRMPRRCKGFYLDIGAYHPTRNSVTYFLYRRGWTGICVDMSEATCRLFRKRRPRDIAVCAGVADREGAATGYFVSNAVATSNSMSPDRGEVLKTQRHATEKLIDLTTVDRLMHTHAPHQQRIDFINIDVEGYEQQVIQGIDLDRLKPACIAVEIHPEIAGARDVHAALETPLARHLHDHGYRCAACCVVTYFFVRKDLLTARQGA